MTAEQLLHLGDVGPCELIHGELVAIGYAGFVHGDLTARAACLIAKFVEDHGLGIVLAAGTGYLLATNPDLVRAPTQSFVRKDRLPESSSWNFFRGAPDLAVEVLSPDDTKKYIAKKVSDCLSHGTISCWIIDPVAMTLTVHRDGHSPVELSNTDHLPPDPALPGFTLGISKIFRRP